MEYFNGQSAKLAYKLYGSGDVTLVIDTAIGACSAEWWHIAEKLRSRCRVLVYDRAGYGQSSLSSIPRTSDNICTELYELLSHLQLNQNLVLIGHSQGGFYAVQYALLYPESVEGLILLDPATPFDFEFKEKLSPKEYQSSGVDKTFTFRLGKRITAMGLGALLKPLLKKAPPFFYCDFGEEEKKYLLRSLCSKSTYLTALEEYKYTHMAEECKPITNAISQKGLKQTPVTVITHDSGVYGKELETYGSLSKETAEKIENLWQELMKRYLSVSAVSKHICAPHSGHYIHLTDYEVLESAVSEYIAR